MNYQYSDLIDEYVEQQMEEIRIQIAIAEEKTLRAEQKQAEAETKTKTNMKFIMSLIRQGIVTVEQIAGIMSMPAQDFIDKYGSL